MPAIGAGKGLQRLSAEDLESLFDKKIMERGIEYFKQGRLQRPIKLHSGLRADCRGTMPESYHVKVDLKEGGMTASCTCPYAFGYCKHIAAALYGWSIAPEIFKDLGKAEETLGKMKKEEVISILMEMVTYDPDVLYVINLRLTPREELPAYVRKEMGEIFSEEDIDYLGVRDIVNKLEIFMDYAGRLTESGEPGAALMVISPIVEAIIYNYTRLDDADLILNIFFRSAIGMYGKILSLYTADVERRKMLVRALDWLMDAEWGLEDIISSFISRMTLQLKEKRYMISVAEVRVSELKKRLIKLGTKYSEEHDYLDERVRRLEMLISDIKAG